MTTSATADSFRRGQTVEFGTTNPLKGATIKKQTVLILIVMLALFAALAIDFQVNANGKDDSSTSKPAVKAAATSGNTGSQSSAGAGGSASGGSNGSSVNIQYDSSSTTSSDPSQNSSSSSLTVNGQKVPTSGGNVHEHYTSDDGSTTVNVDSTSHSSAGGESQ